MQRPTLTLAALAVIALASRPALAGDFFNKYSARSNRHNDAKAGNDKTSDRGKSASSWRDRWQQARSVGVSSLYAFLSAMALWPVVEAARQGEWAALAALGSVAAGVAGNLLANQIQSWKDEADAARQLAQGVEENAEIRAASASSFQDWI